MKSMSKMTVFFAAVSLTLTALTACKNKAREKLAADLEKACADRLENADYSSSDEFTVIQSLSMDEAFSSELSAYLKYNADDTDATELSEAISASEKDFQAKISTFIALHPNSELLPCAEYLNVIKKNGVEQDFSLLPAFEEKYPDTAYLKLLKLYEFLYAVAPEDDYDKLRALVQDKGAAFVKAYPEGKATEYLKEYDEASAIMAETFNLFSGKAAPTLDAAALGKKAHDFVSEHEGSPFATALDEFINNLSSVQDGSKGLLTDEQRSRMGALLQTFGGNNVKTVALTQDCIIAVYDEHECYNVNASYVSSSLAARLDSLQHSDSDDSITDIHLTEEGEWVILGSTIYWSDGAPRACIDAIKSMTNSGDTVICVSFNDRGDWAVISDKHWNASSSISGLLKDAQEDYGMIYYANVTNHAVIVTCENGLKSSIGWDAPIIQKLDNALDTITFKGKMVKLFYDGSFFIGNQDEKIWAAVF